MTTKPKSDVDIFLENFVDTKNKIDDILGTLVAAKDEAVATTDHEAKLDIAIELYRDLERDFNQSASMFASYNKQSISKQLADIWTRIEEVKQIVNPPKKFKFGIKKKDVSKLEPKPLEVKVSNSKNFECEARRGFSDRTSETLTMSPEETDGQDLLLERLTSCQVDILGHPGIVFLKNLTSCHVKIGPVTSSVFVTDCRDCEFELCSQQIRVHDSVDCILRLRSTSGAILENCSKIRIARYEFRYDGIDNDLKMAGIDDKIDKWDQVVDFNWLSQIVPSPNWSLLV